MAAPTRAKKSTTIWAGLVVAVGALASAAGIACNSGGFDSQSKVESVRIFGVRPDKPFANPGDAVTLQVLAADGRPNKPRPMKVFWLPFICMNPTDDLYYLCFGGASLNSGGDASAELDVPFPNGIPADAGIDAASTSTVTTTAAGDAGGSTTTAGSILARIPTGTDLSPFLTQGDTFSFQMPADAVQAREGSAPYGLAIIFNIACAGQVRIASRSGNNPQQVPILCTDEQGTPLGSDDYVIGINRVYSYPSLTNTNPVVQKVTLDGVDVDQKLGFTFDHCVAKKRSDCPTKKIDVVVSDASWEANPSQGAENNREQIWVTYYSDIGDIEDEARLLFDTRAGRVTDSGDKYRAPYVASEGTLWAVVHDNRAGAAFLTIPIHVK